MKLNNIIIEKTIWI